VSTSVRTARLLALTITATVVASAIVRTEGTPAHRQSAPAARMTSIELPLRFEQLGLPATAFVARGAGYAVSVSEAGAMLVLKGSSAAASHRLTLSLVGSRQPGDAHPASPLPGVSNYLVGNDPTRWARGVHGYARIEYREVYPGIDVAFYGTQRQLEYDFIVAPGRRPDTIVMAYSGGSSPRLDPQGDLVITTPDGDIIQRRPQIYQTDHGIRKSVRGRYTIARDGTIRFRVGDYDRRLPLIIDPMLSYATYLGGTGFERVGGVAVDAAGDVFVAGTSPSADFPVVTSLPPPRDADVFVAKLSPSGDALVYATYFGGFGYDTASGMVIDDAGNAYVTGYTESQDFPTTARFGPRGGISDAFVVKVDPSGALAYAVTIGGGDQDYANAVAVDAQGRVRISGNTISADFPVVSPLQPQLGGSASFHSIDGGRTWSAAGVGLKASGVVAFAFDPGQPLTVYAATARDGLFRTVDGGTSWTATSVPGQQRVSGFATQGNAVFVATDMGVLRTDDHGDTWTNVSYPSLMFVTSLAATSGAAPALYAGNVSGVFRSRDGGLNWNDAGLHGAWQFLAASGDVVYAASALDVGKSTAGGPWTFSNLRLANGITALTVDPNNPQIVYVGTASGLFKSIDGGTNWVPLLAGAPYVAAIAVSPSDSSTVFVSASSGTAVSHDGGQTWSATSLPADAWPISIAVDPQDGSSVYAGMRLNWDAFLVTMSADGSRLESSTFIGGRGSDIARGVAVDANGNTYVAGETESTDFLTRNPIQATLAGQWDAFVMKLGPDGTPVYSTYLGGSGTEFGGRIAVDAAGRAYLTGITVSPDFPVVNAAQPAPGGGNGDAYVTALNASGTAIVYSTFLGGNGSENPSGIEPSIAVTPSGEAAVTGATQSSDFPVTVDALRRSPGGRDDAFLTQFEAAGGLRYSTYLGRPSDDYGQAVAVDSTGVVVVAGYTNSTSWSTAGVVQPNLRGSDDAFIVKIVPGTPPPDTIAPKTTISGIFGTIGSNGWFTSPVTVTLTGLDDPFGTGLAFFEYSVNGGTFQRYSGSAAVSAQGVVSVAARATDWSGNVENPPAVTTLMIDSVPPSASVAKSGTLGLSGWYTSPVTVSISATDATSGVALVEYRVNGGAFQRYTAPFSLATQGANTVVTRTTDQAGNVALSAPFSVPIDTSAPTTTVTLSGTAGLAGWYRSAVTVSLSAVDAGSGVDAGGFSYRLNGGAFQPYTAPFMVATDGATRIDARAVDRAGNVATTLSSASFMIDSTAPAVTVTSPQPRDYLHTDTLVISFAASDSLSGLLSAAATLDQYTNTLQDSQSVPLVLLPLGAHTMNVSATDVAGNTATRAVPFRIVATVGSLMTLVNSYADGGYISDAQRKSLLSKLQDAQHLLDNGNATGAAGSLRQFIDQCTAQSGHGIATDAAAVLIGDAQYVLGTLQGPR
jgi:photosystem II stability/assembly factor-like uncharacterized protein